MVRRKPVVACNDRGMSNLVAIYGGPEDHRVDAQLARLANATDEARIRDIGYLEVRRMPQEAQFREIEGLGPEEFMVVLVRDGAAVGRWPTVVDPAEVWRAYDGT